MKTNVNAKRVWGKQVAMLGVAGAMALGAASDGFADTLELDGKIRDFKRGDWNGGHLDFETAHLQNRGGYGHVTGLVTMTLDADGKPEYNPSRPNKDTVYNSSTFSQWFRDTTGVNLSMPLTLTLDNGSDTEGGVYTIHDSEFFPVDGLLYGNQNLSQNYHFTFELNTTFTYEPGQKFTFIGDDDVWVYVNGTRVIDLGGVHSAITGNVLLFDGKAFVVNNHFTTGGMVQQVSSAMASQLATKWSQLGLSGNCPISQNDKYVDLDLLGDKVDLRAEFNDTTATVYATSNLSRVTLKFSDGTTQRFDNLNTGTHGTFTGSGAFSGKSIIGVWVRTVADTSAYAQWISAEYGSTIECTLDFFFAERHTTQSNFRIDTSMRLQETNVATVSPMYD